MRTVLPIVSTLFQSLYLLALLEFAYVLATRLPALYEAGDPRFHAGTIAGLLVNLVLYAAIGLIGALLAYISLRQLPESPDWFRKTSRFFAWAWMPFVPLGTIVGIYMLRWLKVRRIDRP
ncbi:MAG: hypothetical protein QNJ00_13835 [Woeseiaceae bacterium]|nr:hypothetical protein [Woeseiaceae bacterium]